MEIYQLPTATAYLETLDYQEYDSTTKSYLTAQTVNNIVVYEDSGNLELARLGITHKGQIAYSIIDSDPARGKLHGVNYTYDIISTKLMKNPLIKPYWQVQIKKSKKQNV